MLFHHGVGVVGELGFAQSLQAHVLLPVEPTHIGIAVPDIAGKLPVDDGIGALDLGIGLFKVDVKAIGAQPIADGKGHHLTAGADEAAVQFQRFKVVHGVPQGQGLGPQVPGFLDALPLAALKVPVPVYLQALIQILPAQRLKGPVGVGLFKPADMVAFGVELFAGQIGQTVDIIDIVPAVPLGGIVKLSGNCLLYTSPSPRD